MLHVWFTVIAATAVSCSAKTDGDVRSFSESSIVSSSPPEPVERAVHGGQIAMTISGRLELLADRTGRFKVWLLDARGAPRSSIGIKVFVKLGMKGSPELELALSGDHFEGNGTPIDVAQTSATVTIEAGATTESSDIPLHVEGEAQP